MGKKKQSKDLFGDDDCEDETKLQVNNSYATNYDQWRRKEELNKAKARYGDVNSSEEEADSSSSDEEPLIDREFDIQFFKTLSALKKKDPKIYQKNESYFKDTDANSAKDDKVEEKKSKKMKKPLHLKDYEAKLILETNGKIEENSDDETDYERNNSPTFVEEQRLIKDSLKKVLESDDNDGSDLEGGLFKKRVKTKEEQKQEDDDYEKWLKGQTENVDDDFANDTEALKTYWNDPSLDNQEKFLKDYILNKRFLENNDDEYIPTYDEIVHDSDENLSEDEKAIEQQEQFEMQYNMDERDSDFLKRYPRTMEQSVRKKDNRRKQKRAEVRARKEEDKQQKREELQRLKALKRKEIEAKIEKLKEVTGYVDVGFNENDLEDDFDPNEHDKRMSQLFNAEFYAEEERGEKPKFPELDHELEIENWDEWNGPVENDKEPTTSNYNCEDPEFNMDCDYDPTSNLKEEMLELSKNKRKRRRKSKFAQVVETKKKPFDARLFKTYEAYLDEYYKLDYEDKIGDLPCRFKYREVVPNDFGLQLEEILQADDKELNRWCSLKKAVQIRPDHVEKYDVEAYKRKANNENLKRKIFHSLFVAKEDKVNGDDEKAIEETVETKSKKRKRKVSASESNDNWDISEVETNDKHKKKHENDEKSQQVEEGGTNHSSSKINNKKKKKEPVENNEESTSSTNVNVTNDSDLMNKKKKKKQKKDSDQTPKLNEKTDESDKKTKPKLKNNLENTKVTKQKQFKKKWKNADRRKDTVSSDNVVKEKLGINISDERLKAYGIKPKKFKNKLKFKK